MKLNEEELTYIFDRVLACLYKEHSPGPKADFRGLIIGNSLLACCLNLPLLIHILEAVKIFYPSAYLDRAVKLLSSLLRHTLQSSNDFFSFQQIILMVLDFVELLGIKIYTLSN